MPKKRKTGWSEDWPPQDNGPVGGAKAREAINRDPGDERKPLIRRPTISAQKTKPVKHARRPSSHDGQHEPGWRWSKEWNKMELGTPAERARLWEASQLFIKIKTGTVSASEEYAEFARDSWDWRDAIRFDKKGETYINFDEVSLSPSEADDDDDLEADEDSIPIRNSVVQNSEWNPFRDLDPHARRIQREDLLGLMERELGADDVVLTKLICGNEPRATLGYEAKYETAATASAFGKGMVLGALRRLVMFFDRRDRLESGQAPLRECRQAVSWDLAGRTRVVPKKDVEEIILFGVPKKDIQAKILFWDGLSELGCRYLDGFQATGRSGAPILAIDSNRP
jgi:hypothetical protein